MDISKSAVGSCVRSKFGQKLRKTAGGLQKRTTKQKHGEKSTASGYSKGDCGTERTTETVGQAAIDSDASTTKSRVAAKDSGRLHRPPVCVYNLRKPARE